MKINLHIHSNYSLDGKHNVQELINTFKDNKYDIISITDHDTCEAYKHIIKDNNIKIITGIEADAIVNNHTYDFLCYNFNLDEVYIYAKEKYQTIDKRQTKIFNALVDKCKENNISLTNIDSYNSQKEYAHHAIYRMLDKGFINKYNILTTDDFYRLSTIDTNFPLYIDMHIVWPDIKELSNIIHKNNGKIFLAHPYRYNKNVYEVLNETKDYIDGIEVINNPVNFEEVDYLYKYAKDHNLLVSLGSDYHDDNNYDIESKYLTEEIINDVLSWM